jgi:acetyl esterase/lipase/lysophospholipase L1-like esterase
MKRSEMGKIGVMACLVVGIGVAVSRAANPDDGKSLERGNERPQEIPLWPEGRMTSLSEPEKVIEKSKDPVKQDRRIFNVSIPTITLYRPASTSTNAPVPAVVICPGGAYGGLAFDIEGSDVARWLNSLGIAGVVLKYRVPMAKDDGKHRLPLQDAQRALSLVRSRAAEWNLDPQRIGVMGFSAGGHLAVNACNHHECRAYDAFDAVDQASCRPDFAVLVYPAYLAPKSPGPDLYPEIKVTSNTPPTFLVHAEDDPISVENSLFYYLALKKANVPAQMVLYAKGGHGYGLGIGRGPVAGWPQACRLWMEDQGIVAGEGERVAGCQVQQNYFLGSQLITNLNAGKPQTVVTYGTSLTAGGAWVGQMKEALDHKYKGLITVINSGKGGMWSKWGVDNLDALVIQKKPDTVFIEFAMNDAFLTYKTSVAAARTNLLNMIDRIQAAKVDTEIILMTMNPPIGVHLERRPKIADYVQMYRDVAKERTLQLIDNYPNWERVLRADAQLYTKYVPDGIHPGAEGYRLVVIPAILKSFYSH